VSFALQENAGSPCRKVPIQETDSRERSDFLHPTPEAAAALAAMPVDGRLTPAIENRGAFGDADVAASSRR
jgi:hypothetical protein